MKKTVQVNLSGQVFTLDEDAYELLSSYLFNIGKLYERSPGKEEILSDIEVRIVELFLQRLSDARQVITILDVEAVIEIMGRPEQFEQEEFEGPETNTDYGSTHFRSKRLYRDPEHPVIGGVCGGIGYYFGVDPLWFRLAFAVAVVFFGTGILLYILLWIIIPEAKTASEKLSMRGEPVNISSIGKTIEEEMNSLGERISREGGPFAKEQGKKFKKGVHRFFSFLAELVRGIFNVLGKFIGTLFLIVGVMCIIALLAGIIGIADFVHFDAVSMTIYEWGDMVFESSEWLAAGIIAFLLVAGIPFIALAYGGFLLLMPNHRVPYLGMSLLALWFLGLVIGVFTLFSTLQGYSKEETTVDEFQLNHMGITSDTIVLDIQEDPFNIPLHNAYRSDDFMMKIEDGKVMVGNVTLNIQPSRSKQAILEVVRSAEGGTFEQAREKVDSIQYFFSSDTNRMAFDAYFSFPVSHLLRSQEVKLVLRLPEGKTVYLTEKMKRIIYDIDNVTYTYDPYMVQHHWRMEKEGLTCTDCEDSEPETVEDTLSL